MNLCAKTEYACLAVLDLAVQFDSGQPVQVRRIAERHGIPAGFLTQILLQLKGAGLVASTRGASGGYRLDRPPAEISLGDVVDVIEGPARVASNAAKRTPESDALLATWAQISDARRKILETTNFASLATAVRSHAENMFYI